MAVDTDAVNDKKDAPKTEAKPAAKKAPAKKSSSSSSSKSSSTKKAKIGETVVVTVDPRRNNGASETAGIITRVHEDGTVNVRALLDTGENQVFHRIELASSKPKSGDDGNVPTKVAFRN